MSEEAQPLDPWKTLCIVKHDGNEVGRIPAAAVNATAYIDELASVYGSLQVEYAPATEADLMFHELRPRSDLA